MSSRSQQKLSNEFLKHYPTAQVKKLGADNFVDIHLPFVHDKRGTHLFFNTSGGKIKLGFYCRDEEFTTRVLSRSSELEAYSQGVRLAGNPAFNTVEDAVKAAQGLVTALGAPAPADKGTPTHQADKSAVTTLANLMVRLLNSPEYKWLRPEGVNEVSDGGSSVRLHICTVSGIFRQFQVRDKMIHAEYYFNPERIDVYDHLVRALNADTNHIFANGSYGNGPSKGSSRTIKLTQDQGANMVAEKGEQLAKEAIEAFISLIDYIEPSMPVNFKGWSQRHSGTPSQNPAATAAKPSAVETEEPTVDTNDQDDSKSLYVDLAYVYLAFAKYIDGNITPVVTDAIQNGLQLWLNDSVHDNKLTEVMGTADNYLREHAASSDGVNKILKTFFVVGERLNQILSDDLKEEILTDLRTISLADGEINETEGKWITGFGRALGVVPMAESTIDKLKEIDQSEKPNLILYFGKKELDEFIVVEGTYWDETTFATYKYVADLVIFWRAGSLTTDSMSLGKIIELLERNPLSKLVPSDFTGLVRASDCEYPEVHENEGVEWYFDSEIDDGPDGFDCDNLIHGDVNIKKQDFDFTGVQKLVIQIKGGKRYEFSEQENSMQNREGLDSHSGVSTDQEIEDDEMEASDDVEFDSTNTNDGKEVNASEFTIPETLAFLYIACAGADGTFSEEEKDVLIKELNGWSQSGPLLPTQRLIELLDLWANLSEADEVNLVITIAEQLKQKFDEQKLKTVFADLIKIANALDGVSEEERKYLLTLANIWQLS